MDEEDWVRWYTFLSINNLSVMETFIKNRKEIGENWICVYTEENSLA